MTDQELLALNIYKEAGGEMAAGRAAIAKIVKNRMARRFFSDGTIQGTILAKDQFSWAWFGFEVIMTGTIAPHKHVEQGYVRLAYNKTEAEALADRLRLRAVKRVFEACDAIGQQVMAGDYHGPLFDHLGDDAVSYLNPRILTRLPKWATPDKLVVSIGHHDFYRA